MNTKNTKDLRTNSLKRKVYVKRNYIFKKWKEIEREGNVRDCAKHKKSNTERNFSSLLLLNPFHFSIPLSQITNHIVHRSIHFFFTRKQNENKEFTKIYSKSTVNFTYNWDNNSIHIVKNFRHGRQYPRLWSFCHYCHCSCRYSTHILSHCCHFSTR